MNTNREQTKVVKALFFGIEVELICAMTYLLACSHRQPIVHLDTGDLEQPDGGRPADDD